ncbi:glycosyltransferase family 4 protein [Cochlodiniinecator piscidefendens]|uniref:glycosyltransferase family 4 protein n=1 Tax=Cochlodiniinecator piscidefendens TaxID=2715756 RepID=UPI00140D9C3A|nr:glycosyltransferase family 4 protein [Cochlodiniinecator piscidefendens]
MKILIVHQDALPPSAAGGTRHFTLARWLGRRGHDVSILASRHNYNGVGLLSENDEDIINGVHFIWLDEGARGNSMAERGTEMIKFAFAASKKVKQLSREGATWDVVIGSSPQPFAAWSAGRIARRLKLPFVVEIRDLWPLSLRDLAGWGPLHPGWILLRVLEKHLYRKADHIITLLPGSQKWMIASGAKAENISVVPNGIDKAAAPDTISMPNRDTFTCVYAGAHGIANGLSTVVRAAALLPKLPGGDKVKVRLIGDGETKTDLIELANTLHAPTLEFRNSVPKSQVQHELSQADACILHLQRMPTFAYGVSPNKLFDYLLAARPILYAVESANDPVSAAQAGITLPSENPEALAKAMIALAQTPHAERQEMGKRGHAYVLENHEWETLAIRVEGILTSLIRP